MKLAVVVLVQADGMTQMVCCARPRFSTAYFGASREPRAGKSASASSAQSHLTAGERHRYHLDSNGPSGDDDERHEQNGNAQR